MQEHAKSENDTRLTKIGSHLLFAALSLIAISGVTPAYSANNNQAEQIAKNVQTLTAELKKTCPVVAPDDQAAYERCKQGLYASSTLRQNLNQPVVLWGRQKDPTVSIKETNLTQLNPDTVSGLYMPLFMFNGQYKISYNEKEKLYQAALGVAFRNRLQPGQFPYPFWHEANKWNTYENAHTLLLWINPELGTVRVVQFSVAGEPVEGVAASKATPPAFDGKWLWTDDQGHTQPAVTLFDGLYQERNPYKGKLDQTYRDFAITLRESQCFSCHVPDNPDKMKRLVLLQSPAHASAEITRVLKAIREQKMPLDEQGIEKPLDIALANRLLEKGSAFESVVNSAKQWEKENPRSLP